MLENLPLTLDQQFPNLHTEYVPLKEYKSLDSTIQPQVPDEPPTPHRGITVDEPIESLPPLCVMTWYGATLELLQKVIISHPYLLTSTVVTYCLKYKDYEMASYFIKELEILYEFKMKPIIFRNSALLAQAYRDGASLRLIHYLSYVVNKLNPTTIRGQCHPLLK